MRTKILASAVFAAALALAGCSGSSGTSGSSTAAGSTTGHTTTSNAAGSGNSTGTSSNASTSTSTTSTGGSSGNTTGTPTSTTTGSGGSTSGNTSGSGGSTTGTTGTCNLQCPSGESCANNLQDASGNTVPAVCACTPGAFTQSGVDSCSGNQDGKIVCDLFTLTCREPEEYDAPNTVGVYPDGGGNNACAFDPANGAAFIPVRFCTTTFDASGNCVANPDGGANSEDLCVGLCGSNADCGSAQTCRLDQPFYCVFGDGGVAQFADGGLDANCATNGGQAVGFCDLNVCGNGLADDGGVLNGDYFAACDAHGTGDGTCLPELQGAGLCQVAVDAGPGTVCNPDAFNQTTDNACGADDICLITSTTSAPGQTGICLPMCNANAANGQPYDVTCPSINGQALHCNGFSGPALPENLKPGFCD